MILGVHTPEFEFEKVYENVVEAAGGFELEYPIVQDNDFGTWRAFNNRYWPAKYLIDHNGKIRYSHFGEGAYDETEMKIREILSEAGYEVGDVSASAQPSGEIVEEAFASSNVEESQTRELYAGFERNVGALRSMVTPPYVAHVEYYDAPDSDVLYQDPGDYRNHFLYLNGLWTNGHESLTHARETVDFEDYMALKFFGTSANAVMSPGEGGAVYEVRVYLNGAPVPTESAGGDILYDDDGNSYVAVDASRMYYLIDRDGFAGGELRLSSNSAGFLGIRVHLRLIRRRRAGEGVVWERGRPAGGAALARVTLTLALSHKGRGDPPAALGAWFRMAGLAASDWIPAFAGMTVWNAGNHGGRTRESRC